MKPIILATAFAVTATAACLTVADESASANQGRQILEQSAAAIKKLDRIAYDVEYHGTAWVVEHVPAIQGRVVVGKQSKHEITEFFCDVTLKSQDSEQALKITAGSDGDQFFLIDPETKKAHLDMDPAVLGSQGRNVQRVVLDVLAAEKPYAEDLEAETITHEGTESIDGHDCHKIRVVRESPPEMIYFLSKSDLLPRRVVRQFKGRDGEPGTTELTLAKLTPNPNEPKNPFKLQVPEGFQKTDDFAP